MKLRLAFIIGITLATAASTQHPTDPVEAALLRHIMALSNDAMEGRKPGTPGGGKAVRYIVRQMQAVGLVPGAGDGWYQPVDLVERKAVSLRAIWRGKWGRVSIPDRQLILLGTEPRQRIDEARLIFAGYGLETNLAGMDMRGAIVLFLPGTAQNARDMPSFERRRAAIIARGAAAAVMIAAADARWASIRDQYHDGRTLLAADIGTAATGVIANMQWRSLAALAAYDARRLEAAAGEAGFRAVALGGQVDVRTKTAFRRYGSVNVIGRIEGTQRPNEALLYMAHWDHLGICRRPGVPDRICNGAVDNASGIAVMLETARGLAQGPKPGRTILFVATTAEEMGLLGARAFARNPPIPAKSIVAALNLDTVALATRGAPVAMIGRGTTALDPLIDATARALGRKVDGDTEANGFIARQDGWELANAGIPAVMVGGAFSDIARLETFFASRYHRPSDDIDHGIELGGAAEDMALHIALGRVLADPARFPTPAR
jgi:hypothetical protein